VIDQTAPPPGPESLLGAAPGGRPPGSPRLPGDGT